MVLPLALVAGLATFASPCFLPVVPVFVSYVSGSTVGGKPQSRWQSAGQALIFIIAFALVFSLFAALAGMIGWAAADYRQIIRIIAGVIVVIMGVHMAEIVSIPFLDRIFRVNLNFDSEQAPNWRRSLLLGLAFGAGWTPCVGPMVVAVTAAATSAGSMTLNVLALIVFSVGFGAPFILLAVGAQWFTNRITWFKKHPVIIHRIAGIVLIISGLLIIADLFQRLGAWIPIFS